MAARNCTECERLKNGVYAIVAALVRGDKNTALELARTTMYGGSVLNPFDVETLGNPGHPKHIAIKAKYREVDKSDQGTAH